MVVKEVNKHNGHTLDRSIKFARGLYTYFALSSLSLVAGDVLNRKVNLRASQWLLECGEGKESTSGRL